MFFSFKNSLGDHSCPQQTALGLFAHSSVRVKVNDDHKSALFELDQVYIFQGISLPETTHSAYSNGLAIWHSFPDITHISVNNGHKSAILNMI